jgi:hypothetical protein
MRAPNRWLIQPGRSGVPSSRVNTARVGPGGSPREPLSELALAPRPEDTDGARVDRHLAVRFFALGGVELVVHLGLADVDAAAVQVKVGPSEPGQL